MAMDYGVHSALDCAGAFLRISRNFNDVYVCGVAVSLCHSVYKEKTMLQVRAKYPT
jgi:hypothetical protein